MPFNVGGQLWSGAAASVHDYRSIITRGLVLHYDAGTVESYPGSGTTWSDLSGNGLDGTLTNGPTFNSGNGGSIVFDGSNDAVKPTANALFNIREQITVTAWVKPDNSGTYRRIVNKEEDNATYDRPWALNLQANDKLSVGFNDYDLNVGANTALSDGTWYHVGFTYNKDAGGSDEMKIYLNAVVDATGNYSTILDSSEKAPGIGAGYIYNVNPDSPFEGNIANVQIYNIELSKSEITHNFYVQRHRFGI